VVARRGHGWRTGRIVVHSRELERITRKAELNHKRLL
jgi:hypothetical protein